MDGGSVIINAGLVFGSTNAQHICQRLQDVQHHHPFLSFDNGFNATAYPDKQPTTRNSARTIVRMKASLCTNCTKTNPIEKNSESKPVSWVVVASWPSYNTFWLPHAETTVTAGATNKRLPHVETSTEVLRNRSH